jgi:hypothetical protein
MRRPCSASVYPLARQWLGKHVPPTMNTHAATEELLDAPFSMQYMSYVISKESRLLVIPRTSCYYGAVHTLLSEPD